MRDVKNISFDNCSVSFEKPDGRPAVVVENGQDISFRKFSAMRSPDHNYDILLTGSSNCHVKDSKGIATIRSLLVN